VDTDFWANALDDCVLVCGVVCVCAIMGVEWCLLTAAAEVGTIVCVRTSGDANAGACACACACACVFVFVCTLAGIACGLNSDDVGCLFARGLTAAPRPSPCLCADMVVRSGLAPTRACVGVLGRITRSPARNSKALISAMDTPLLVDPFTAIAAEHTNTHEQITTNRSIIQTNNLTHSHTHIRTHIHTNTHTHLSNVCHHRY
jgi:hypothetical protein